MEVRVEFSLAGQGLHSGRVGYVRIMIIGRV